MTKYSLPLLSWLSIFECQRCMNSDVACIDLNFSFVCLCTWTNLLWFTTYKQNIVSFLVFNWLTLLYSVSSTETTYKSLNRVIAVIIHSYSCLLQNDLINHIQNPAFSSWPVWLSWASPHASNPDQGTCLGSGSIPDGGVQEAADVSLSPSHFFSF